MKNVRSGSGWLPIADSTESVTQTATARIEDSRVSFAMRIMSDIASEYFVCSKFPIQPQQSRGVVSDAKPLLI